MKKIFQMIRRLYYNETLRYLAVGGCTTLVNMAAFYLFCDVFGIDVTLGNVMSIVLAILFAYVANKMFVFSSKTVGARETFFEFCRFVGGRMSTMAIEVGGVFLIYNVMGYPKMAAKLATQVLVIVGNYFISKFLVFRNRKEKAEQEL